MRQQPQYDHKTRGSYDHSINKKAVWVSPASPEAKTEKTEIELGGLLQLLGKPAVSG